MPSEHGDTPQQARPGALRFRAVLRRDARHCLDGPQYTAPLKVTPVRALMLLLSPEFQVVASFRTYAALHRLGWRKLAYLLYLWTKRVYGCDLAPGATIGPGLRLPHAQDVVIGPDAVVGADSVLFNGVTLGNRDFVDRAYKMPILGDRVMVGTGAKLLGGIIVGDDARIGANAVVLASVPVGGLAVGNPARVLDPA